MNEPPINRWSGAAPILMSLAAFFLVLWMIAKFGVGPHPKHDEGTIDHIFIVLMWLQLPIIAAFVFSGRRELKRIFPILTLQLALWAITAAAAVYLT